MVIYGVALLSFCMLIGVFTGDLLGDLIGVQANVGGVGIAMLLLILLSNLSHQRLKLSPITESGVNFWNAMYIPIVVAMAASQNVIAAVSSGWMAIIAGVLAVVAAFLMIPVLARFGKGNLASSRAHDRTDA
jgi:malonate transporter MadL subunit